MYIFALAKTTKFGLMQLKTSLYSHQANGYVTIISNAILCGMCKRKSISHKTQTHTHAQTRERANALHLFLLT